MVVLAIGLFWLLTKGSDRRRWNKAMDEPAFRAARESESGVSLSPRTISVSVDGPRPKIIFTNWRDRTGWEEMEGAINVLSGPPGPAARASLDQPKPQQVARFTIKNEPSRLIFAKISTTMLQTPGAESAILNKLRSDYDNPPPTEGVYLTFVTIDGKQQMLPANSFRGALKETATSEFLDSSIKLRSADGKTITIPVTQVVSYTR